MTTTQSFIEDCPQCKGTGRETFTRRRFVCHRGLTEEILYEETIDCALCDGTQVALRCDKCGDVRPTTVTGCDEWRGCDG